MLCPVCRSSIDSKSTWKTVLLFLLAGFLVGFVIGQLFFGWQVSPIFRDKLNYLEKSNKDVREELRKSPPLKKESEKKSPITQKGI